MKIPFKNILIISFVAVLGLAFYFISQNSAARDSMQKPVEVMMPKESEKMKTENEVMEQQKAVVEQEKMMEKTANKLRYVTYSNETFANSATNRRVLFFYASWCPTCKPADESFTANESSIPEDVTVIRVNYNDPETDQEEKELAKKYGITYQHTFVQLDEQGKELTKWNGGKISELLENIK